VHFSSCPVGGAEGERESYCVSGPDEETGESSTGGSEAVDRRACRCPQAY